MICLSDLLANNGANCVEDAESIDTSKSWELISFDDVANHTQPLLSQSASSSSTSTAAFSDAEVAAICDDAARHWEKFYAEKQATFFQTRHYLHHAFPELLGKTPRGPPGYVPPEGADDANLVDYPYADRLRQCGITAQSGAVLLEAGCGTGSSLYSLAELLPNVRCAGCDLSQHAIDLVRRNAQFNAERIHGFVWDLSRHEIDLAASGFIQPASVDVITSIFMLSAVHPDLHHASFVRLRSLLKPGGLLLFRDYALYDMTQVRFHARGNRRLAPNLYVRGDQTVTYYFSLDDIRRQAAAAGLDVLRCEYDVRKLLNRKRKLTMYRVWICAVLQVPPQ